ncbi:MULTISPECIES: MFS transporter [Mesotoga]|uniref:MFS transporter n=1 Tax=Mesotoga TaxID=1184396 RepID=UPI001F407668|nr:MULTISPECIES: MFS transporter [Mesotoga]
MIRLANSLLCLLHSRMGRAFPALKVKNFRYFWIGQLISVMGTWMQTAAQSWLVLTITDSPFLLGLLGVAQFTPVLLFSLPAGVFVDRFPKRSIVLLTQTISMILALILAILVFTDSVQYWHIFLLALGLGMVKTLDIPARQSFMIELVGRDVVLNAVALNSTVMNLGRVVGPAVAGVVMALVGAGWCFLVNGVTFLAVIFGLLKIDVEPVIKKRPKGTVIPDIKEGLVYLFSKPILTTTTLILAIVSTFGMNYSVLIPVFARNQLGLDAQGYGLLMSALGVGSMLGALIVASSSSRGPNRVRLFVVPFITSSLFMIMAFNRSYAFSALLIGLMGFANIFFTTTANSLMQINSDNEFRGRVMSVYSLVFAGSTPIGNMFVGSIADKAGGGSAFFWAGVVTFFLVAATIIAHKIRKRSVRVKPEQHPD